MLDFIWPERHNQEIRKNPSLIGVSKSAISMYELGKREPDYEILEALCNIFNVDSDHILGRKDEITLLSQSHRYALPNEMERNLSSDQRYLMAEIIKATPESARKFKKLWDMINEEERNS